MLDSYAENIKITAHDVWLIQYAVSIKSSAIFPYIHKCAPCLKYSFILHVGVHSKASNLALHTELGLF